MELQSTYYTHILNGVFGDAAPLMARIALNIAVDSRAYPVDLSEISALRAFNRDPTACGLAELFVADLLRCALLGTLKQWAPYQIERLIMEAAVEPRGSLRLVKSCQE